MNTPKSRREENAEATRNALIHEANLLFAKNGFSHTSLSKIAEQARVTKGAVYHHFDSKVDIFAACYRQQAEYVADVVRKVPLGDDPWEDTVKQCKAYLDCGLSVDGAIISIQEAITVLGWARWRELDEAFTMGLLKQNIGRLQAENLLKPYTSSLLVDAIYGILINAMMSLVMSEEKENTRDELLLLIQDLILGVMVKK